MEFQYKNGESVLRGNTLTMKCGDVTVERSVGAIVKQLEGILRRVIDEDLFLELDEMKIKDESEEARKMMVEENALKLRQVVHEVASIMFSTRFLHSIPFEIRCISRFIRDEAIKSDRDPMVLVGTFVILRMINPVIASPEKRGIKPKNGESLTPRSKRTLVLMSKVIQNMANEIRFGQKEPYMACMNPLLEEQEGRFQKFLLDVCATDEELSQYANQMDVMSQQKIREKSIDSNPEWKELAMQVHSILDSHRGKFVENMSEEDGKRLEAMLDKMPPLETPDDTTASSGATTQSSSESKYRELLERAQREDLSDLERKNLLSIRGRDKQGRPIAVFTEQEIDKQDLDRVTLYLIRSLDKFVEQDYVLVYCINNQKNQKRPGFQWILSLYRTITRKYKKNLKALYMVHPIWLYKVLMRLFRPFVSDKFWRKLTLLSDLNALFDDIDPSEIPLAPHVLAHNILHDRGRVNEPVFGVSYELVVQRSATGKTDHVPLFFRQILEELETSWAKMEGIFRIPGSHSTIQQLKLLIDHGYFVDFSQVKGHALTGLVKLFFREMPTPLLCYNYLYHEFLQFSESIRYISSDDDEPKEAQFSMTKLQSLLGRLPDSVYAMTKFFMEFLHVIAQHSTHNLMTPSSLAVCIAPNLLSNQGDSNMLTSLGEIPRINKMVTMLIEQAPRIFKERPEQTEIQMSTKRMSRRDIDMTQIQDLINQKDQEQDGEN